MRLPNFQKVCVRAIAQNSKTDVEGLAGQCKKQGSRKKLADLLRKQCQCLCECKGECEGECKATGQSNKKGGKNWGLARERK